MCFLCFLFSFDFILNSAMSVLVVPFCFNRIEPIFPGRLSFSMVFQ